jgi:ABC-type multidrug transport system ATPase subunit
MDESSSAVRSLLDIGFYLRHEARIGDLLIVDEPELNLHPENQRRIAKLFARLINIGIKVFITTHSDYIIKEINTLIMLNHDQPHLKEIAAEEGYRQEELLSADQVKVYIAEQALEMLKGKKRKTKFNTLTPAKIDPEMGIEARSFDTTIEKMNRIQTAIIWGEE